jgi:hypothetical protein
MSTPEKSLDTLQTEFGDLLPTTKPFAKDAAALHKLVANLAGDDGYAKLKSLSSDLDRLDALRLELGDTLERARATAVDARKWLAKEWKHRAASFATELATHLGERGITTEVKDGGVQAAPFFITLDAAKDSARVTYGGEPVGKATALDCERVYRAYVAALQLLERGQTLPETFADTLIEATAEANARKGGQPGSKIRLPDVHFALFIRRQTTAVRSDPRKGKVKEYPRYQFLWDLGLLVRDEGWLKRGETTITLFAPSANAAKSRADSVRVPGVDGVEVGFGDIQVR